MQLRDKVAIVTGSTSGIGKATAYRFVAEGAKVTVMGRNANDGQVIEQELRDIASSQQAGDALFVRADVSRADDVRHSVAATVERWGAIDILVNNAATMTFVRVVELDEADWDQVLAVNLRSAFLLAKYCIPHMPRGSAIVNVSSVHAAATGPEVAPYAASKGASRRSRVLWRSESSCPCSRVDAEMHSTLCCIPGLDFPATRRSIVGTSVVTACGKRCDTTHVLQEGLWRSTC